MLALIFMYRERAIYHFAPAIYIWFNIMQTSETNPQICLKSLITPDSSRRTIHHFASHDPHAVLIFYKPRKQTHEILKPFLIPSSIHFSFISDRLTF